MAAKVEAQCYTSRMDTSPSAVIADCGDNVPGVSHHGTAVAQAVMDMAPQVSLYISNSALGADDNPARTRLKQDVDWMIAQGVKVINYSIGWGLTEGLGDGAPQEINAVLDTIDTAVNAGIIWVNSAGNEHRRRWHGPFTDTNLPRDTYHDYALNDDRNYINNVRVDKPVIVEMRWDDSWKGADCDVDLRLFRDGLNVPVRISIKSQFGRADDKPYEEIKYSPTVAGNYYLQIRKFRCPDASDLSWLQLYVSGPYHLENFSTGYSIEFPAESKNPGTLAVGAAKWSTPGSIQSYSSRGPTTDGRKKPEIVGADCGQAKPTASYPNGFCGASQAASHVSGMAALVKDRFPDYSPEQIAIYLKENAEQRIPPAPDNTDPNNIWGHGFVLLPDPADTASLSPVPSQITAGQSAAFTLSTNVPASTGVRVAVNYPDDTGNLAVSSLGAGVCPGSSDYRLAALSGSTVSVKGCTAGTAQVRLYKRRSAQQDALLQVYMVTVKAAPSPTPPTTTGSTVRQTLNVGDSTTVNVSGQFAGVVDSYTASSSNTSVATAAVTGSAMTITGVAAGNATITVTASNSLGNATQTYGVTVTSVATVPPTNGPTANAGLDKMVKVGSSVSLSGTGFPADPDEDVTYSWTQVSGTTVSLRTSANSASFTAPSSPGTLVFRLTVTDIRGVSASDDVTVKVALNRAPVANAGADRTAQTGRRVFLNASGTDPDGDALSYSWSQVPGRTVTLNNASGVTAYFTAPSTPGTLTFRLTVSDGSLSTSDDVTVTVTR